MKVENEEVQKANEREQEFLRCIRAMTNEQLKEFAEMFLEDVAKHCLLN